MPAPPSAPPSPAPAGEKRAMTWRRRAQAGPHQPLERVHAIHGTRAGTALALAVTQLFAAPPRAGGNRPKSCNNPSPGTCAARAPPSDGRQPGPPGEHLSPCWRQAAHRGQRRARACRFQGTAIACSTASAQTTWLGGKKKSSGAVRFRVGRGRFRLRVEGSAGRAPAGSTARMPCARPPAPRPWARRSPLATPPPRT
jgi:hypothetical protein